MCNRLHVSPRNDKEKCRLLRFFACPVGEHTADMQPDAEILPCVRQQADRCLRVLAHGSVNQGIAAVSRQGDSGQGGVVVVVLRAHRGVVKWGFTAEAGEQWEMQGGAEG